MAGKSADSDSSSNRGLTIREYQLRKYEARIGLWKIAIGTALVGVASVLIPGSVEFWESYFQNQRAIDQIEIERESAQRDTITTFIEYALNEDIELRLRMAEYFSVVAKGDWDDPKSERAQWKKYYDKLVDQRSDTKKEILYLERERVELDRIPPDKLTDEDFINIVAVDLKLKWLYGELGRAARGKSVVATANESKQTSGSADAQNFCTGKTLKKTPNKRDADPNNLHPELRRKVQDLISDLNDEGLPFKLFEGYRSPSRQSALFYRRPKVTWVGPWGSSHNFGLGADIVLQESGTWSWDDSGEKAGWWMRMHDLAKENGLETLTNKSGKVIEKPHVQLPGTAVSKILRGEFPQGGDSLWAENLANDAFDWRNCPGKISEFFLSSLSLYQAEPNN